MFFLRYVKFFSYNTVHTGFFLRNFGPRIHNDTHVVCALTSAANTHCVQQRTFLRCSHALYDRLNWSLVFQGDLGELALPDGGRISVRNERRQETPCSYSFAKEIFAFGELEDTNAN